MPSDRQLYFGDLHNHNAVGYAQGSLSRSFEIAREHLDFFAFTGHAQWHDMPTMPDDKHMKWVNGFETHKEQWPRVKQMTREANDPGRFVTLLGYEWHSSACGDYCALYPDDDGELLFADSVEDLAEQVGSRGGLLFPHHTAYAKGWRGIDWDRFPADACPVVEVFSEHGACMYDRGPHAMIRHSNGGRTTTGTTHAGLARGLRFGIIAGTDDHFGYPGAYGEGLAAVWADALTREGIWEAIHARRTYAVTGDRIALQFTLNGEPMGSELQWDDDREIAVSVDAMGEIREVAVLKNGRVVHREHAPSVLPEDEFTGGRAKVRVQWGWGPWAALEMARVCDWKGQLEIEGGTLLSATPCFQSGPYEEDRRDRFAGITDTAVQFESYTSRQDAFAEGPTKGAILEVEGEPEAVLRMECTEPADFRLERSLAELSTASASHFTGPFTSESVLMHRLLMPRSYTLEFTWTDPNEDTRDTDYYMVRVTQANGHMAWSSPIWVDGRTA